MGRTDRLVTSFRRARAEEVSERPPRRHFKPRETAETQRQLRCGMSAWGHDFDDNGRCHRCDAKADLDD